MDGKCQNCGANMRLGPPGSIQRCEFCGAESRAPEPNVPIMPFGGGPPLAFVPPPPPVRRLSPVFVLVPVGLAVGLVALGVVSAVNEQRKSEERARIAQAQAMQQANDAVSQAQSAMAQAGMAAGAAAGKPPPAPKVRSLDELGTAEFQGWEPLAAPGMTGTLDAFDAIANLAWAADIGRHWSPDARIHRIDFDRVDKSGVLALVAIPDAKATYRYVSPTRTKAWNDSVAVTAPDVETEMMVSVTAEGVRAIKLKARPYAENEPEIKPPSCTLAQAFAALEKAKKLPEKPVFNGYLLDSGGMGPRYLMSTINGTGSMPSVDAKSCALR